MKVSKLAPVIAVKNVAETVEFYTQHLDFKLAFAVPEDNAVETAIDSNKSYRYAMLQNNGIEIAFQRLDTFEPIMNLV
ncbi:MAG: VOC family protein, partial [Capnocytophaga sp.]|nr:VOC family protein [Capnocytophaga sp.]